MANQQRDQRGPPVFAHAGYGPGSDSPQTGLRLHDLFAAVALHALILRDTGEPPDERKSESRLAADAYDQATRMLECREAIKGEKV